MEDQELTEKIIGCAMKVHSTLGPGFLELVYQKALAHELAKAGLKVECGKPITVHYDSVVVGDFSADMLVENRVMLELKANQALAPGAERLEFKRKTRTYHPKKKGHDEDDLQDFKL